MISDYDEDEHFCIKCHITISGLDNYINHRKANCIKTITDQIPKSPLPSQLLSQDESFGLKADDFFSSLELQSSNKKQAVPSTSGKSGFSGVLTRSKTSAVIHASTSHAGAQVQEVAQSKSGKNAWIGGHQLKGLGSGDNQTKLIKAVDNLSRSVGLKKDGPAGSSIVTSYNDNSEEESDEYDYDDEDEDDEEVPRHHTGGKWMPEWSYPNVVPPINHTGGKWKPKAPPQNHTKGKWKPASMYEASVPPPTYTKGKWKPVNPVVKETEEFPPPGHTKGKWKPSTEASREESDEPKIKKRIVEDSPPFRKSNGSIQYWCNPCNRLLSSKIVYERHIKSELHFKRILHEAEFDDTSTTTTSTATTTATATSASTATHLNTNHDKEAKRTIRKPVEYWSHTSTTGENNKDTMKNTIGDVVTTTESTTSGTATAASIHQRKKRIRRKIYAKCEVCLARVTAQMMGKHLISHYHCRKGDITRPEAKQMVLDNIHDVVLQSPYQCAACKFYCNTHEDFLTHWNAPEHAECIAQHGGILTCAFCKFSCSEDLNQSMYEHLTSLEHDEVISVINRSVPIIIKNLLPVECATCSQSFTFNVQLRHHCQITKHELSKTATDEYQKKEYCHICSKAFNSSISLQRHFKTHNASMFFCTQCNVKFSSAEEIAEHRKTSLHKFGAKTFSKKCDYCQSSFATLDEFRIHLQNQHPHHCSRCPQCGKTFTLPQQLSVHLRSKACNAKNEELQDKPHKCDQCVFGCDTVSELIFHKALHGEPLQLPNNKQAHYKCSLCEKYFPKSSLRFHIQNHTNEKMYQCKLCDAKFARKNNWIYHLKRHENKDNFKGSSTRNIDNASTSEKNFLCATCGAKFSINATLKKHMLVHMDKQFKCDHPGCIHMARTPADLRVHRGSHSEEMSFRCEQCDYRGKTKQALKRHATVHGYAKKYQCSQCSFSCRLSFHLRRHERIHTGSKPFACPHCAYRCNDFENLRKHVLATNKHPGKCLYECKLCEDAQFQSNFAKDFKVHLLSEHGDVFVAETEAAGYIASIYDSGDGDHVATTSSATVTDADVRHKADKINPTMLETVQVEVEESDTSGATLIQLQEATFENKSHQQDELFPMYVIAKDEVVYVDKEAWCMVGNFGVEESGALVSFNDEETDAEPLFQEHF